MTRASWTERLAELVRFIVANQRMPVKDRPDERSLFLWVERQRTAAKNGTLDAGSEAVLDAATPEWRSSAREDRFTAQLVDLTVFYQTTGHLPSEDSTDRAEELLGRWLWKQRKAFRDGTLTADRKAQLDIVSPGWTLGRQEQDWLDTSRAVAAFHDQAGRLPNRKSANEQERTLGAWLHNQRRRLDDEQEPHRPRIDTLNTILPGWRGSRA